MFCESVLNKTSEANHLGKKNCIIIHNEEDVLIETFFSDHSAL